MFYFHFHIHVNFPFVQRRNIWFELPAKDIKDHIRMTFEGVTFKEAKEEKKKKKMCVLMQSGFPVFLCVCVCVCRSIEHLQEARMTDITRFLGPLQRAKQLVQRSSDFVRLCLMLNVFQAVDWSKSQTNVKIDSPQRTGNHLNFICCKQFVFCLE